MRHFRLLLGLGLLLIVVTVPYGFATRARQRGHLRGSPATNGDARGIVQSALEAMGGEVAIRSLKTVQFEATRQEFQVDQATEFGGTGPTFSGSFTEIRDLANSQLLRTMTMNTPGGTLVRKMIVSDGVAATSMSAPGFTRPLSAGASVSDETIALGADKVLINALDSSDLRSEGTAVVNKRSQNKVGFTWRGIPVHVFLNANTSLLTAVELTRPIHSFPWDVMGDVTTRIEFSDWRLDASGIDLPARWETTQNGMLTLRLLMSKVEYNVVPAADAFTIPDEVKTKYRAQTATLQNQSLLPPNTNVIEVIPGVFRYPGGLNTTIVRQDDGLVILDTPINSNFSEQVIDEAAKRFPGVPIKAVVVTASTWIYFAGVREYIAKGIPVYVLDTHQRIVNLIVDAKFKTEPDSLAKSPRKPIFKVISEKTTLGNGRNRIELYPTRTSEERMVAYFPETKLLYASDFHVGNLTKPFSGGMSHFVPELFGVLKRQNLTVDKSFSLHIMPFVWSEFANAFSTRAK